jgi:hypothetical protein
MVRFSIMFDPPNPLQFYSNRVEVTHLAGIDDCGNSDAPIGNSILAREKSKA